MSEKVVGVDMGTGPSWAVRVTMEDGKVVGIKRRMELIQWPRAKYWTKAWNPVVGCKPVSPACEHCYAKAWAERFGESFEPHETKRLIPKGGVVFCGNMTDLFGPWNRTMQIFDWFSAMWTHDQFGSPRPISATYLWLTKRAGRLGDCVAQYTECSNAYFGITAETNEWFDRRMMSLAGACDDMNKAKWWLSCEPLLGPISLSPWTKLFSWVVVGCESGPHRRPCTLDWVEDVVAECQRAKVPVFVKQICLPDGRFTNKIEEFPAHLRIRQVPWKKDEA